MAAGNDHILDLRTVGRTEQATVLHVSGNVEIGDGMAVAVKGALKGLIPGANADGRPGLAAPGAVGTLDATQIKVRRQLDRFARKAVLRDPVGLAIDNSRQTRQLGRCRNLKRFCLCAVPAGIYTAVPRGGVIRRHGQGQCSDQKHQAQKQG